ncbi:hypothetical protein [Nocardia araoensis]|uniref:hypothetical protein n=1 Tax=Nocardia araoensis TaxID=228600 RepID=UPI0002F0C7CE|nr:hypothetical protein [Nocardia araoensis]
MLARVPTFPELPGLVLRSHIPKDLFAASIGPEVNPAEVGLARDHAEHVDPDACHRAFGHPGSTDNVAWAEPELSCDLLTSGEPILYPPKVAETDSAFLTEVTEENKEFRC